MKSKFKNALSVVIGTPELSVILPWKDSIFGTSANAEDTNIIQKNKNNETLNNFFISPLTILKVLHSLRKILIFCQQAQYLYIRIADILLL